MTLLADRDCVSCGERLDEMCENSEADCGHHCNHSWSHEVCCWCGQHWGDGGEEAPADA